MLTAAQHKGHRWSTRQLAAALLMSLLLMPPEASRAASGDLDPTFGAGGMVISGVGLGDEEAVAVAAHPDGGMVVVGDVFTGVEWDFLILRYRGDGTLDASTWGTPLLVVDIADLDLAGAVDVYTDGTVLAVGEACNPRCQFGLVRVFPDGGSPGPVTTSFGTGDSYATAVKFQPDGKALVAGSWSTPNGDHDVGIARYLPDGSLDPDFGLGGKVTMGSSPGVDETAGGLALQANGRILVSGTRCIAVTALTDCEFLLLRYLADGSPDPSFGVNGIVTTPVGTVGAFGGLIAVQADGRIVVAGTALAANYDFAVVRYESDGTLDASFGTGGKVTTPVDIGEDAPSGLAIDQATGTITLAGYACNGVACPSDRVALVRYRSDGGLDPSFGAVGVVTTAIGPSAAASGVVLLPGGRTVVVGEVLDSSYVRDIALVGYRPDGELDLGFGGGTVTSTFTTEDIAYAVAIQADGKIVVAGTGANLGYVVEVARYGADGALDSSFGTGGVTATNLVSAAGSSLGLVLQPDGKIVVAGSSVTTSAFGLVRYNQAGTLDASFGSGGVAMANFAPDDAYGRALARQPDGKLVVAGSVNQPSGSHFALARYNADGSLDPGFGLGGTVITPVSATSDEIRAVAVQTDGKIVAAGYAQTPIGPFTVGSDFAIARYNGDGSLDPSFGSGGIVTTAIGESAETHAIVVEPDGKIVVAGEADAGAILFALARYLQDGSLDPGFGSGGIVTTQAGVDESYVYGLALDNGGRIVAVGATNNLNDQDVAVARYNPDGTLDPTFGVAGVAQVSMGPGSYDIANGVATQPDGKVVVAGLANAGGIRRFGLARFITSTCGNGASEPAEQCDDGNLATGDGCDALCRNEEQRSQTVPPNGVATTDTEADGATPTDAIETAVTSPAAGGVTILETSPEDPPPSGYQLLDQQVTITAPVAAPAAPLSLIFRLDASVIPSGESELSIAVFRNGVLVLACTGTAGTASPDPCVTSRLRLADGDVEIGVLTSAVSTWTFAVENACGAVGAVCYTGSGDQCDPAKVCTATSTTCPAPTTQPGSFPCRAAANECDRVETCPGTAGQPCPADAKMPAGTPCTSDGNSCTTDVCNGAGTCTHIPTCGTATTTTVPGGTTTTTTTLPALTCGPAPMSSCSPATKASLKLAPGKLHWKWLGGSVALGDFGSPPTTTDYLLCVYDTAGLKMSARAPAGRTCAGKPCWKSGTTGFKYADKTLTPDGIKKLSLTSGTEGKITVQGKGPTLPAPTQPLASPVRVQLKRSGSSTCWEATDE